MDQTRESFPATLVTTLLSGFLYPQAVCIATAAWGVGQARPRRVVSLRPVKIPPMGGVLLGMASPPRLAVGYPFLLPCALFPHGDASRVWTSAEGGQTMHGVPCIYKRGH